MRSLFIPLQLATDARGLEFITDLDPAIDAIAREALYENRGDDANAIARQIVDNPEEDGVVVGDETRLRQIITNLARYVPKDTFGNIHQSPSFSNACKFTPTGGKLTITTKLVVPNRHPPHEHISDGDVEEIEVDPTPKLPSEKEGSEAPSTTVGPSGKHSLLSTILLGPSLIDDHHRTGKREAASWDFRLPSFAA